MKPSKPTNSIPVVSEDIKELCCLCRQGRLFSVQQWFKSNQYVEPLKMRRWQWPMGIAIDSGFHSMVETLLMNGVKADVKAMIKAVQSHRTDMVELMFQYGGSVESVSLESVVSVGTPDIFKLFLRNGADLNNNYALFYGLTQQTRGWLGIYKNNRPTVPSLQFQADMALRHFCDQNSLYGTTMMMWLGADPRAVVPVEPDEDRELWDSALMTAAYRGNVEIIKKLKPNPTTDNLQDLLFASTSTRNNINLIKYWISTGADINRIDPEYGSIHRHMLWGASLYIDPKKRWLFSTHESTIRQFVEDWFGLGVRWDCSGKEEVSALRAYIKCLTDQTAYRFIKLLKNNNVIPVDQLAVILNTPVLKKHLFGRRHSIASMIPGLRRWSEKKNIEG